MALDFGAPFEDPTYPLSARPLNDPRTIDGKKGDEKLQPAMANTSVYDAFMQTAGKTPKSSESKTVNAQDYDDKPSATDAVKSQDPDNSSGSIKHAPDLLKTLAQKATTNTSMEDMLGCNMTKLLSTFSSMVSSLGASTTAESQQITSMLQQGMSQIQANSAASQVANTVQSAASLLQQAKDALTQPCGI